MLLKLLSLLGQESQEVFYSLFPSERSSKNRISRSPSSKASNGEKLCTSRHCPFRTGTSVGFCLCFPQTGHQKKNIYGSLSSKALNREKPCTSRYCPFRTGISGGFLFFVSRRAVIQKNNIYRSLFSTALNGEKPCTSCYCPFRTVISGGFLFFVSPQAGFLCLDGKEVAGEPRVSQSSSPIIHSIRDPSKEYRRSEFKQQFSSQCGSMISELYKGHQKF